MSQRTLAEVMGEFLELQITQNTVALEVAHKRQLLQSWNDGMERAKHDRDKHQRYWDLDFALKCEKRYEDEAHEAEEKFDANQKRLKELKDEAVALMTAPR